MANKNERVNINRSYTDNFDIKEYTTNTLIPKYFTGNNISERTIGLLGLTTEQISNISEDVFNTGSVYMREVFPNRAEIPESIYSHAAIFELSNLFATASSCRFILVLDENSIINNLQYSNGIGYFYIDKNTIINVEGIDFSLDYDIMIKVTKKYKDNDTYTYVFAASYMISGEMNNAMNPMQNPYIPIKRSADGFLALEVRTGQYTREIVYETIIDNAKINAPILDIPYEGKLAGFDVMYKTADESTYTTQLKKQVKYSQPSTTPFCYYSKADENTLRITFNSKDLYFSPAFNSSLKITLYLTEGVDGNFSTYTGNNIAITQVPENYQYPDQYLMAAKPIGGASGGLDELAIDNLQRLSVQGFRTANALTTEPDLAEFFSNYSYIYGKTNAIKFIKRRNDVYERVYTAMVVLKDSNKILKTNTLNIDMNIDDMNNPEKLVYTIEPGTLFKYKDGSTDNTDSAEFFHDNVLYDHYKDEYTILDGRLSETRTSPFYTDDEGNEIEYSILKFIGIEKYDYFMPYFSEDGSLYYIRDKEKDGYTKYQAKNKFKVSKDDTKIEEDNIDKALLSDLISNGTYIDELSPILDILVVPHDRDSSTTHEYLYYEKISLAGWIQRKGYNARVTLFELNDEKLASYDDIRSTIVSDTDRKFWYESLSQRYLFVNPFLIRFMKNPNSVNMYLTFVDNDVSFDFTDQNDDSFLQFITVQMSLNRTFEETKRYKMKLKLEPNITANINTTPLLDTLNGYYSKTDGSYYLENIMGLYDHYNQDDVLITANIPLSDLEESIWTEENPNGILMESDNYLRYKIGDNVDLTKNYVRVIACMKDDDDNPICFVEFKPTEYDEESTAITFEADFFTDDHITSDGRLRISSESRFYDRRVSYTYYVLNYPVRSDGSAIYDDVAPIDAKDLINMNELENGRVLYTNYKNIKMFELDVNRENESDVEYADNIIEYKNAGRIATFESTESPTVDDVRDATDDIGGVFIYVAPTESNHDFYIVYLSKDGDKLTFKTLKVGKGYTAVPGEVCYPELYETANGQYYAYPRNEHDYDSFGPLLSNPDHADGFYTKSEIMKLSDQGLVTTKTVNVNPRFGNYYMQSQTKEGYYNYYCLNEDGEYYIQRDSNGYAIDFSSSQIPSFSEYVEEAHVLNMSSSKEILVPMNELNCEVHILTKYKYVENQDTGRFEFTEALESDTDNIFIKYDSSLSRFIWTNKYSTITDGITLVKPLTSCKVYAEFSDWTLSDNDINDIMLYSVPFIKYSIAKDPDEFSYFIKNFSEEYDTLTSVVNSKLRNLTDLDIKLYNTYGLATNFIVGESGSNAVSLDTLNLCIEFDIWFETGTDMIPALSEVKLFIKEDIEKINSRGLNNLYISNLMRKLENTFDYINHIRFVRINNYSSDTQTVKNLYADLDDMTDKEERRLYVPEILTVDIDNIIINDYTLS